ncbi:hypothetical protein O0I10_003374 [Lichtheimia ornata]|uniref:Uncharacterized protein n=1 Tax=Lichtheimia ornata TaxID=688661 RepID=A0AAD7VAU0_9FUNG|nr:uncharacterized protein O0I10_003374 [Lichtheimia ornata]KAJ8660731.1 hypothetical protein O0I10_003374 [Lichtheimia ornata]
MSLVSNANTMNQSSTPTPLSPPSHSNCCCGRDNCHTRQKWQEDMHELKNDARTVADIAQELLKENEQLEQQLSERTKQVQQLEARLERVNAMYKDVKHDLKAKSNQVRDMQLFVQDTVCEARTREVILRGKLKAAEGKTIVAEHKLKVAEKIMAKDKPTNDNQGTPLLPPQPSHTKPPQPSRKNLPPSTQPQPSSSNVTRPPPPSQQQQPSSSSKPASLKPTLAARPSPFVFKNVQPVNVWTTKVTTTLQRLKATDLHSMKQRAGRPYDKADTSAISNSLIQSILFDIERLHTTEHAPILDICKALLYEIGELRTRLNDSL